MNRSRAIASTVAVTGVLVSLTVAGVAVVNATDSDVATESTTLVVASEPLPAPSFEPKPLPEISLAPLTVAGAPTVSSDDTATPSEPATSISRAEARSLVLAQAPGQVVKTWAAMRDGYRAYAVKVLRPDGSLATGFVDRASGVVFDWTTVAARVSSSQSDDEREDAYDDEDESDDAFDDEDEDSHDDEDDEVEFESHDEDDD